jgi:hypothetical protein
MGGQSGTDKGVPVADQHIRGDGGVILLREGEQLT